MHARVDAAADDVAAQRPAGSGLDAHQRRPATHQPTSPPAHRPTGEAGSDAHDDIAGLRNRIGTFTRDGRHIIDKHQVMRYLNLPLN